MVPLTRIARVARDLEVSERTIGDWISRGILRHHRVGRLVFLDPIEVVEDIKAHAANSSAKSAEEKTEEGSGGA